MSVRQEAWNSPGNDAFGVFFIETGSQNGLERARQGARMTWKGHRLRESSQVWENPDTSSARAGPARLGKAAQTHWPISSASDEPVRTGSNALSARTGIVI